MYKFDLDITLITPSSDIPLKLNFFYKKTLCHEFWFMPWETAMSKKVSFPLHMLDEAFDLKQFTVLAENKSDILFESILVNQQVQSLSQFNEGTPQSTSETLSYLLQIDAADYSVVKISDLPDDISVSYGYNCNNSIYIPGCDIGRAEVNFGDKQHFSFKTELFKANVVEADKELICSFHNGKTTIEEKIKISSKSQKPKKDVKSLRKKIAEHYKTQSDQNNIMHNHAAPIVDIQNAFNTDAETITSIIQDAAEERYYSVIKLCGLPKNIFENNVFYNDGAHFLTKETVKTLKFKNIQKLKRKTEIAVHFFGENTETPLKTLMLHLENAQSEDFIKTKTISASRKKSA